MNAVQVFNNVAVVKDEPADRVISRARHRVTDNVITVVRSSPLVAGQQIRHVRFSEWFPIGLVCGKIYRPYNNDGVILA